MLEDQRGDVEIRGADQPAIDVMAKETIRAEDENAAKKISDNLKLEMVEEAGHYVVRSNRRSLPDERPPRHDRPEPARPQSDEQ